MKKRIGAVGLTAALLLSACSNGPEEGVVEKRSYEAPSTIFVNSCSGNPPVCTMIPVTTGPSFDLYLNAGEEKGWRSVSQSAYDKCREGTRYPECAR